MNVNRAGLDARAPGRDGRVNLLDRPHLGA